jgi:YegS/Rv2252/BmrU family lipid kinase
MDDRRTLPRATLIWNPAAGRKTDDLEDVRRALEAHVELSVIETSDERKPAACARDALVTRPDLLIAAGGDGTVSAVASALIGAPTPLAILARGTSNSIAAGLDVPTDLASAVGVIAEHHVRAIDTAKANDRVMLLHAAVGFHAATIGETEREAKNQWGMLAYVAEGLEQLRALEPFEMEMHSGGELLRCRATNVAVANIAPRKTLMARGPASVSPEDGLLDVTIVAASTLGEVVGVGLHLLRTTLTDEPAEHEGVGYCSTRSITIRTAPAQPILIDGEPCGEGELHDECLPKSLHVIVPRTAAIDPPARPSQTHEGLSTLDAMRTTDADTETEA